jgi:hypothetical protein
VREYVSPFLPLRLSTTETSLLSQLKGRERKGVEDLAGGLLDDFERGYEGVGVAIVEAYIGLGSQRQTKLRWDHPEQ